MCFRHVYGDDDDEEEEEQQSALAAATETAMEVAPPEGAAGETSLRGTYCKFALFAFNLSV